MTLTLPPPVDEAVRPLLRILPPDRAMGRLVPTEPPEAAHTLLVEKLVVLPVIAARLPLVAALWLYVDALDRSHKVSQTIEDATGSFWHGIMHRREGDFSNSHYWFNRAGTHPAMTSIEGYDPHQLIDEVKKTHAQGDRAELVELQRREWISLFEWCCVNAPA